MLHYCRRLPGLAVGGAAASTDRGLVLPWLAMAAASIIVPWLLVIVAGRPSLGDALAPSSLLAALWPVAIGVALSFVISRVPLPRVPEGDIVGLGERAAGSLARLSAPIEYAERGMRHWPVAGTLLLAMAVVLGAAMLSAARLGTVP